VRLRVPPVPSGAAGSCRRQGKGSAPTTLCGASTASFPVLTTVRSSGAVSAPIALAGRRIRCPILWWLQVAFGLLGTFKGAVLMSLISRASPGCPIQAVIASATRHSRTSPRVDGPSRLPAGHRWQPRSCGEAVGVRGAATSVTAIDLVAKASGRSYHRERADGWGETL
jgi:hypothetical protein